jgi:hypothetical protein
VPSSTAHSYERYPEDKNSSSEQCWHKVGALSPATSVYSEVILIVRWVIDISVRIHTSQRANREHLTLVIVYGSRAPERPCILWNKGSDR